MALREKSGSSFEPSSESTVNYASFLSPWREERSVINCGFLRCLWTNLYLFFVSSLVEICPLVLVKIFNSHQCILILLVLSTRKKKWHFIWTNLNGRCSVPHFVAEIGSGEDFKVFNAFLLFCYYLFLEKPWGLHLNKHEFPLPKNALCQVWLITDFEEFTLLLFAPLGKGCGPSYDPCDPRMLSAKCAWNLWFWRKFEFFVQGAEIDQ